MTEPTPMTDERLAEIEAYYNANVPHRPFAMYQELRNDHRRLRVELAAKEAECERLRQVLERIKGHGRCDQDVWDMAYAALNPRAAE